MGIRKSCLYWALHAVFTGPCMQTVLGPACSLYWALDAVCTGPCMQSVLGPACSLNWALHAVALVVETSV